MRQYFFKTEFLKLAAGRTVQQFPHGTARAFDGKKVAINKLVPTLKKRKTRSYLSKEIHFLSSFNFMGESSFYSRVECSVKNDIEMKLHAKIKIFAWRAYKYSLSTF